MFKYSRKKNSINVNENYFKIKTKLHTFPANSQMKEENHKFNY